MLIVPSCPCVWAASWVDKKLKQKETERSLDVLDVALEFKKHLIGLSQHLTTLKAVNLKLRAGQQEQLNMHSRGC